MATVIVTNNDARLHQVQVGSWGKGGKLLSLPPGASEVDEELWALAKEIAVVKALLEGEGEDGKPSLVEQAGLPKTDEAGARALLADTFDRKLLAKWEGEEKRAPIKALIAKRISDMDRIAREASKQQQSAK